MQGASASLLASLWCGVKYQVSSLSGWGRCITHSAFGGVGVQAEQVVQALLDRVHLGQHVPGSGAAPRALIQQDGLLDAGRVANSSRTLITMPACAAWRRSRCATASASTQ